MLFQVDSVIYWRSWQYWGFIPLIAILVNLGYLTRVLQSPLFDSASQPNTESLKKNERATESALTIATYNVNSFNHEHTGFSCKEIAAYMKELGVDISVFKSLASIMNLVLTVFAPFFANGRITMYPLLPAGESLLRLAFFSREFITGQGES